MFFTIVFIVVVLVVILKGILGKKEKYFEGSPSGRIAIAFALTTYAYIITRSLFVGATTLILSLIIAVTRMENTKERVAYSILSAFLGVLVVLVVYQIVLMQPQISDVLKNLSLGR